MWELLKNFYPILTLLVPGLVLLFMRSLFMTRRDLSARTKLLPHFAVSVVYYAFLFPAIDLIAFTASIQKNACVLELSLWFFLIFVVPAGLGLFLGVDAQKGWTRSLLQHCGLHPVHPMPTAWDWKFGNSDECHVLVTLKDGKQFAGIYSSHSFVSSDPSDRDIYIQPVCNRYNSSALFPHNDKGILIPSEEIQTIEFWPYQQEKDCNEQR